MSRKPGPSKHKIELILYALRGSPHGTWVRDIAKKTGLTKSTVSNYLNSYLKGKVDVVHESKHIKLVKLKENKMPKEMLDEDEEQPTDEPQDPNPRDVPDYIG
ncbi:MAG TPA: helix-turn-helix domain-containing protein [Nanoarchaeota archaeon]|nr:helix-turn-helix domain-containing protein [Nanoarchaeota archaeon]